MADGTDVGSTAAEFAPGGTLLGVFDTVSRLGQGGMGSVYLVCHKEQGFQRAIKIVHKHLRNEADVRRFFLREQSLLAQIDHDAVVRYYGSLIDDGCLVMEYVPGPSLKDVLRARGRLDEASVLALWQRIAEGLAAVHAKGIIHSDISPGNIILPEGRPELAKLIDFGIASARADGTLTVSRLTPLYASPEHFQGKVTAKSDIFSFGLVLAHAASGTPVPWSPYGVDIPSEVSARLREGILRLVETDPERRPAKAFPDVKPAPERPPVKPATANRGEFHTTAEGEVPPVLDAGAATYSARERTPTGDLWAGTRKMALFSFGLAALIVAGYSWFSSTGRPPTQESEIRIQLQKGRDLLDKPDADISGADIAGAIAAYMRVQELEKDKNAPAYKEAEKGEKMARTECFAPACLAPPESR